MPLCALYMDIVAVLGPSVAAVVFDEVDKQNTAQNDHAVDEAG